MLEALSNLLAPPVLERVTLVLNHVLRAEPVATERLAPHSGRVVSLSCTGWPALLPPPPPMRWRITPAGLLEWCGPGAATGLRGAGDAFAAADLRITVDARNPADLLARVLAGARPAVLVEGDAALAAQIGWLLENLRWDVAADLERAFGPAVAHGLHQAGSALARGLRGALDASAPWAERLRPFAARFGPGQR